MLCLATWNFNGGSLALSDKPREVSFYAQALALRPLAQKESLSSPNLSVLLKSLGLHFDNRFSLFNPDMPAEFRRAIKELVREDLANVRTLRAALLELLGAQSRGIAGLLAYYSPAANSEMKAETVTQFLHRARLYTQTATPPPPSELRIGKTVYRTQFRTGDAVYRKPMDHDLIRMNVPLKVEAYAQHRSGADYLVLRDRGDLVLLPVGDVVNERQMIAIIEGNQQRHNAFMEKRRLQTPMASVAGTEQPGGSNGHQPRLGSPVLPLLPGNIVSQQPSRNNPKPLGRASMMEVDDASLNTKATRKTVKVSRFDAFRETLEKYRDPAELEKLMDAHGATIESSESAGWRLQIKRNPALNSLLDVMIYCYLERIVGASKQDLRLQIVVPMGSSFGAWLIRRGEVPTLAAIAQPHFSLELAGRVVSGLLSAERFANLKRRLSAGADQPSSGNGHLMRTSA